MHKPLVNTENKLCRARIEIEEGCYSVDDIPKRKQPTTYDWAEVYRSELEVHWPKSHRHLTLSMLEGDAE